MTADDIIPRESMKKSAKEYFNKTNNYRSIEEMPIYWLPWWKIENFSRKLISSQNDVNKHRVIKHVWEVLTYKKLSRYNGLGQLILNPISFGYISDHKEHISDYNYDANFVSIPYKYRPLINENVYNLNFQNREINYSYIVEKAS